MASKSRFQPATRSVVGANDGMRVSVNDVSVPAPFSLPTSALPQNGGTAATLVITMDLEQLKQGLGAATLDTGGRISVGEYRRLACNSGVIPAVLGSRSAPLDLGRSVRLHTAAQRTAMAIRDQ